MVFSADVAGSVVSEAWYGTPQATAGGDLFGPEAQSIEEDIVASAGVAELGAQGYAMWSTQKPLVYRVASTAGTPRPTTATAARPSTTTAPPLPSTTAPLPSTTSAPLPHIRIRYTAKMATSPSDANFLRFGGEWAQSESGYLILGVRNPADVGLRSWARRWMDRSGVSRVGLQAMHPLDSSINQWVQSGTPGGTYYFGRMEVNQSFGGQIGGAIKRLNLRLGDRFTIGFVGFPSYQVAPPTAPPSSPPGP
jgi:hypothetical protein